MKRISYGFSIVLIVALLCLSKMAMASFYPFIAYADFGSTNITDYTQFALDEHNTSIEAITRGDHTLTFVSAIEKSVSLGFSNDPWWIRFAVKNDQHFVQHFFLALTPGHFHSIEAYEVNNGVWRELTNQSTASEQSFVSKLRQPMRGYLLYLPPNTENQYYLKVDPQRFFTYQVELSEPIHHLEQNRKRLYLPVFLAGFLLAMAIYRFLLYLSFRKATSLYLSLYLLTTLLSTTIALGKWEFKVASTLINGSALELILSHLAIVFLLLLCKEIVRVAKHSPRINIVFYIIITALLASTCTAIFVQTATSFLVLGSLYLLSIIFLFIISIAFIIQRTPNALLLLATLLPTLSAMPFIIATQYGATLFPINSVVPILSVAALKGIILSIGLNRAYVDRLKANHQKALTEQIADTKYRTQKETLSHLDQEIRTPVIATLGMAEILKDTTLTQNQHEYLRSIQASSRSLLNMLDDVLEYTSINEPFAPTPESSVNLPELLDFVAAIFSDRAHEKNVVILQHFHNTVPPYVLTDSLRLKQILTNTISSALRYAVTGELIIEVGMDPFQPHHVRFEIFGSALQQAGEAFLPFDTNHKTKPENEGNLHIARQLVEQINGRAGVRLHDNAATIWFTVPLPADPENDQTLFDAEIFQHKTLLIVDSSQTVTRILRRQMLGWGLLVSVSHDPREALASIRNQVTLGKPYDAVLFDCNLPGMGGLQFVRRLQEQLDHHPTPLLLMMGSDKQDLSTIDEATNNLYAILPKPLSAQHLHQQLAEGLTQPQNTINIAMPALMNKKVLLAGMSLEMRAHLTALLSDLGATVVNTHSSAEIGQVLSATPCDLLILPSHTATAESISLLRHAGHENIAIMVLGSTTAPAERVAHHPHTTHITLGELKDTAHTAFSYIAKEQS